MPGDEKLIADLKEQIKERKILAVVGAGVSKGVNPDAPGWADLIVSGVQACERFGVAKAECQRVLKGLSKRKDSSTLLKAASFVEKELREKSEFGRWLRDSFEGLRPRKPSLLDAIDALGIPIMTTNYDGLLEQRLGCVGIPWDNKRKVAEWARWQPGENRQILHLHGYWDVPDSVVLGDGSYKKVKKSSHTQAVLKAMGIHQSLLFIGCGDGLNDPNFGAFIEWLAARDKEASPDHRHYRLILKSEESAVQRVGKIQPLVYGSKHAQLAGFLKKIAHEFKAKRIVRETKGETAKTPPSSARSKKRSTAKKSVRKKNSKKAAPDFDPHTHWVSILGEVERQLKSLPHLTRYLAEKGSPERGEKLEWSDIDRVLFRVASRKSELLLDQIYLFITENQIASKIPEVRKLVTALAATGIDVSPDLLLLREELSAGKPSDIIPVNAELDGHLAERLTAAIFDRVTEWRKEHVGEDFMPMSNEVAPKSDAIKARLADLRKELCKQLKCKDVNLPSYLARRVRMKRPLYTVVAGSDSVMAGLLGRSRDLGALLVYQSETGDDQLFVELEAPKMVFGAIMEILDKAERDGDGKATSDGEEEDH